MRYSVWLCLLLLLAMPVAAQDSDPNQAVAFMRSVMAQVNPALSVEDTRCATALPWAIVQQSSAFKLDWRQVFALAWQESGFDCHAKNRRDLGGAYGPFQIRLLWAPVVGDPRANYHDPDLAVRRVALVLRYYRVTGRHRELELRGFRYPLLCLYNTGERQEVNMRYCQQVGRKMDGLLRGWRDYRAGRLIALSD